jgi:hypothetical protein
MNNADPSMIMEELKRYGGEVLRRADESYLPSIDELKRVRIRILSLKTRSSPRRNFPAA